MNVYINSAVRDAFSALDTLTSQKERAELELRVTSRWNPIRRLELTDTINQLSKEISAMQSQLATTPSYAW